jgi:hypothetical protein
MLPTFSFEFRLHHSEADSLPLRICQWGLAVLTLEFLLQIVVGSFSTHNSNRTFLQSRKHFGQSGERGIRFDSHVNSLADDSVTHKCDKNPQVVMIRCDILQKFPFYVMLICDAVKS